jgi:methyl-accepting chemotaxis protein
MLGLDERRINPQVGLWIAVALVLMGALATGLALEHVAPGWVLGGYGLVAMTLLGMYSLQVFLPQSRIRRELTLANAEARRSEERLRGALEQLRAGDVAAASRQAADLPVSVADAFATAARALGGLVQQIQNSSIEVASAGTTVHTTASELASDSSEQAAAVVEITATMEELARTAAQIASNAASQAELESHAEASGNAGAMAVEEAVAGVSEVQKRISAIATRADTLGTRAKEIYRVLDLITEIAQETHILSLNAAIEAAGAGEHGRRFGVVADEVRRLAQRSQESVDSVRNLLDEFAGSIRTTVVATEEGIKEASRVLERTQSASSAIEELRGALADTARAAREISLATQEQRTASDQVVLTLKEVSQVIQRMAEGLKQFSGTADRLNGLALSIQLLTQSFHLDSPRSLKHLGIRLADDLGFRAGQLEALEGQLETALRQYGFIELAYVVDHGGAMVAFVANPDWTDQHIVPPSIAIGASFAERPWFQAVSRERRPILTPVYDSLMTRERCFTVASPIHDGKGGLAGILGLDVNVRSWTQI